MRKQPKSARSFARGRRTCPKFAQKRTRPQFAGLVAGAEGVPAFVLVDGQGVTSCVMLAVQACGRDVFTVEGLAQGGRLHPIQEAFLEVGAVQCGFCIPGIILAAKALLDVNPNPAEEEIKMHLDGNLCRCTGYEKIEAALRKVIAAGSSGGSK